MRAWRDAEKTGSLEHDVRRRDAGKGAADLGEHVRRHLAPRQPSLRGVRQGDRRVEVRAGDRAEGQDQRDEAGAGRERVGEQRDRDVPAREPLAHDARADDRGEEQGRAQRLGHGSAREVDLHQQQDPPPLLQQSSHR